MGEVSTKAEIPTSVNLTNPNAAGGIVKDEIGDAAKRFNASRDKPQPKKSLLQRMAGNTAVKVGLGLTLAAGTFGGGVYVADRQGLIDVPGIHQSVETPSVYDPNAEVNLIIPGDNARPATQEEIQKYLNEIPPVSESPKPGEDISTARVIIPFNPENGNEMTIVNEPFEINGIKGTSPIIRMKGGSVPFYIPIVIGAEKVDIRTFGTGKEIDHINFLYYLNNGQTKRMSIGGFTSKNFTSTSILDEVPYYDYNKLGNAPPSQDTLSAKEFVLSSNHLVKLFTITGSAELGLGFDKNSMSFVMENGKVLYSSGN